MDIELFVFLIIGIFLISAISAFIAYRIGFRDGYDTIIIKFFDQRAEKYENGLHNNEVDYIDCHFSEN